jgi:peroxiredoxin
MVKDVLLSARVLVFWLLLSSLFGCSSERPQLARGTPAPPFSAKSLQGRAVEVPSGVAGQVVAVRFWADWCRFCEKEMAEIEKVYQELSGRGLRVLAVNVGQDRQTAQRFVERLGLSYTTLLDPESKTARNYGVIGLPTTFFIDRQGLIHSKILGESDASMFRQAVEPLL